MLFEFRNSEWNELCCGNIWMWRMGHSPSTYFTQTFEAKFLSWGTGQFASRISLTPCPLIHPHLPVFRPFSEAAAPLEFPSEFFWSLSLLVVQSTLFSTGALQETNAAHFWIFLFFIHSHNVLNIFAYILKLGVFRVWIVHICVYE